MLFNKFRETIFAKNGCELERKFSVLKELKEKYPNNEKLNSEYWRVFYGLKGENEITYELKDADIGMYVLHDIVISIDGSKAQIDYIVITSAHVYFLECKNLSGDIIVDSKGEFRRDYISKGKKMKQSIYSPLRQAEKHKEIFKKIWENKHHKLLVNLFEKSFDEFYKPLVVFTMKDGTLKLSHASKQIKEMVIRSDNLVEYLKMDIKNANKNDLISQKQMKAISDSFLMKTIDEKRDYRLEYIDEFGLEKEISTELEKNVDIESVKEKLVEYRKRKSKERRIPAYYIFNDKELENILTYMPKSIDDLKESGILTAVKIKCHGDEILEIINGD